MQSENTSVDTYFKCEIIHQTKVKHDWGCSTVTPTNQPTANNNNNNNNNDDNSNNNNNNNKDGLSAKTK